MVMLSGLCYAYSMNFFVNVNDDVIGLIILQKGLRQGDHLSHYLFILCAEGLYVLIKDAERK